MVSGFIFIMGLHGQEKDVIFITNSMIYQNQKQNPRTRNLSRES